LSDLGCFEDGPDYFVVARAPAQVARYGESHFGFRGGRVRFQEGLRREDESRRAEAALDCSLVYEGLLQGMKAIAGSQALYGRYFLPIGLDGKDKTGVDRLSIEKNGATAAVAVPATLFRTGQAQIIPQKVKKRQPRLYRGTVFLSVHNKAYLLFHRVDSLRLSLG
jgi:hypothetical protein